jgi:hypothetical protein
MDTYMYLLLILNRHQKINHLQLHKIERGIIYSTYDMFHKSKYDGNRDRAVICLATSSFGVIHASFLVFDNVQVYVETFVLGKISSLVLFIWLRSF